MQALPYVDSTVRSLIQAPRGSEVKAYLKDHFPAIELGERSELRSF
jgi:hypothetical protein